MKAFETTNFRLNKWSAWLMLMMLGGVISSSQNLSFAQTSATSKPPVLLGLYTSGYAGDRGVIDRELRQIDAGVGKHHSLVGIFMDIQDENPTYNIGNRLELLRQNGYSAFINLKSSRTAAEIARGDLDSDLRKVAKAFADWSRRGEGRMAFIAPLQEMNIPGERYSLDANNYKLSYKRIQQIFSEAGVAANAVRWVFAPNGFTLNREHDFENYYPSDAQVDVVAFSAYNWGYCNSPINQRKRWDTPAEVYKPFIDRMVKMAPGKPIFIAQTASSSNNTSTGMSSAAKDQWLRDAYNYLAAAPGVQGILYFNIQKECDWPLNSQNNSTSDGYKAAVANPGFGYVAPADSAQMFVAR